MASSKRVYLLLGPEAGEKGEFLKGIQSSLEREFISQIETYRFYAFETKEGEIVGALQNNSLFADHRLVILSQGEALGSDQIKELVAYLKTPSESATLVIMSDDTFINSKISSLVPKSETKIFWEMFDNRKADWLKGRFSRGGTAIKGDAIDLLLELVENNTQELGNVAEQLITYARSEQIEVITSQSVEQFIQHTRQVSVFSLFDSIAIADYPKAVETLHHLFNDSQNHPISILATLIWQLRRLVSLQELLAEGLFFEDALKEVSVMGKEAPIKRRQDISNYGAAVKNYTLEQTHTIIARLGEVDLLLREMPNDYSMLLFERLLATIIVKKGAKSPSFPFLSLIRDAKF